MDSFFEITARMAEIMESGEFIEYVEENDQPGRPELHRGVVCVLTMAFLTIYAEVMEKKRAFLESIEDDYANMDEIERLEVEDRQDEFDSLLDYIDSNVDYHVRLKFKMWKESYILHGFDVYMVSDEEAAEFIQETEAAFPPPPPHAPLTH